MNDMTNEPTLPGDPLEIRDEAPAPIGHNLPPAYDEQAFEVMATRIDGFLSASDAWLETNIANDQMAERLNDQITGLRKLFKEVDAQRVSEKKPHDEQAASVQGAYKPQLDRIKAAADRLKPKLDAFAREKQRKIDEAARIEREKAAAAAAEAQRIADEAAASNSIDAQVEAEAAQKEAAEAQKIADKASKQRAQVGSSSGGGRAHSVRKTKRAEISNIRHLFMFYQEHPKVVEVLQSLANAHVRAADFDGKDLPGTTTIIS